ASYMSVARSVTDKEYLLISVPTVVPGSTPPAMEHVLYRSLVGDHGKLGTPTKITTLKAAAAGASTFHGTFIEGPKGVDAQMYYWLEQAPIGTFVLKYVLVSNQGTQVTSPKVLSKKGGADYSWVYTQPKCGNPCNIGDYLHGTSYWDATAKEAVFVPSWA